MMKLVIIISNGIVSGTKIGNQYFYMIQGKDL